MLTVLQEGYSGHLDIQYYGCLKVKPKLTFWLELQGKKAAVKWEFCMKLQVASLYVGLIRLIFQLLNRQYLTCPRIELLQKLSNKILLYGETKYSYNIAQAIH